MTNNLWFMTLVCVIVILTMASCASPDPLAPDTHPVTKNDGREYMMALECADVLREYQVMLIVNQQTATLHVSNVYNIQAGGKPHISLSDAAAKIEACHEEGDDAQSN